MIDTGSFLIIMSIMIVAIGLLGFLFRCENEEKAEYKKKYKKACRLIYLLRYKNRQLTISNKNRNSK